MGKKKTNPNRIPTTIVNARKEGIKIGTAQGIAIVFTALLDGGYITMDDIDGIGERLDYLMDSIERGYVNIPDLVKTLRTDYGINYIGMKG